MRGLACATVVLGLIGMTAEAAPLEQIDLSALNGIDTGSTEPTSPDPMIPVAGWNDTAVSGRRFYVTGMIGSSFATLADPIYPAIDGSWLNGTLLTAGGAVGVAFERDNGQLRMEFEGRGRDDLTAAYAPPFQPPGASQATWAADDGWSTLVNLWRDFDLNERLAVYVGGGIGAGGYRYSFDFAPIPIIDQFANLQVATFAWQAGGGVIWNVSDRVAFDVGYRFFSIDQANATYFIRFVGAQAPVARLPQQFTAGELLFSLRIYEPFRRWR